MGTQSKLAEKRRKRKLRQKEAKILNDLRRVTMLVGNNRLPIKGKKEEFVHIMKQLAHIYK